jgi:RimJ/RimL family protein N-acetyltransferase
MHRVELGHAVANTASCRVAEKAGFRLEGTLREANRIAEGFADEHLHARLATDR